MTARPTPQHYREVIVGATARYLRVLPGGLELEPGGPTVRSIAAELVAHGDARTLYRGRKPMCRSLDGQRSATDPSRVCEHCLDRRECTPQIRVDLLVGGDPYRVMLAFTSARNFLAYLALLRRRRLTVATARTRITVHDRGRWGELRFSWIPPAEGGRR